MFSAPKSARVVFDPGVGMRICCPTHCHIARSSGSVWTRDSSAYTTAACGPALMTASAISHCLRALSGSVLRGIASRGRRQRSVRRCNTFRIVRRQQDHLSTLADASNLLAGHAFEFGLFVVGHGSHINHGAPLTAHE